MRFSVLALAYDGTIADHGVLDPEVRQAIRAARAHGVTVVIVTGRSLDDLRQVLGDLCLVDAVVAENGAVIAFPGSDRSVILARPASEPLVQELRQRGIAARVGTCVIETAADAAHDVLDVIRQLELPLVLLFNGGRLMVLPQAVSKATGLREALATLRLSAPNAAPDLAAARQRYATDRACLAESYRCLKDGAVYLVRVSEALATVQHEVETALRQQCQDIPVLLA